MRLSIDPMRLALTFASVLSLSGVLSLSAVAGKTVMDAGGRKVEIADASKILSIGGDITEILYALGQEARIIAVDATSQFPPEALKHKPSVGYMRALSTEGVLSVGASLILASERSGPPEVVKALKQTAVPYVEVQDGLSPEGIIAKVRFVANAVDKAAEGEALASKIESEFRTLAERRSAIARKLRVLFVLNVQNGRATVGGAETSADAIIRLSGADNVASSVIGFKPMVDEALVELQPDAIITLRRSSGQHDTEQLMAMRGMQATPAGRSNRVVNMDGLYLLGFGPRTASAALDVMRALYPELGAASPGPVR
jgi:iron complex transport system substrate-binding protein